MPKNESKLAKRGERHVDLRRDRITRFVSFHWQPMKLPEPRVADDLHLLDSLSKGAEAIRFSVLRFEYWLSPNGLMREWLRWNLVLSLALAIPSILFVPSCALLLTDLDEGTEIIGNLLRKLMVGIPLLGLAALIISRIIRATKRDS